MAPLEDRVKKMAALLDEKRPGWRDELDIKRIEFYSLTDCVLGQLYGSYMVGIKALEPTFVTRKGHVNAEGHEWTTAHAVELPEDERRNGYRQLTNAWQDYLRSNA